MRPYRETVRLGEAPIERGDELHEALADSINFVDLLTAADLRRRAGLGKMNTSGGFTLDVLQQRNPWFQGHRVKMAPVVSERVNALLDAEKFYLDHVKDLREKGGSNHALARADMLLRHASSVISNVSEQVELSVPAVGDMFPLGQYLTRDDSRVRGTHKAMYGFLARREHPIWATIRPPNGFNCRCYVRWVTLREAKSEGWDKIAIRWPNSASRRNYEQKLFPDEGWRGPKIVAPSIITSYA